MFCLRACVCVCQILLAAAQLPGSRRGNPERGAGDTGLAVADSGLGRRLRYVHHRQGAICPRWASFDLCPWLFRVQSRLIACLINRFGNVIRSESWMQSSAWPLVSLSPSVSVHHGLPWGRAYDLGVPRISMVHFSLLLLFQQCLFSAGFAVLIRQCLMSAL